MAPRSLPLAGGAGVRRARARAGLLTLLAVGALAGCGGGGTTSPGGQTGHLSGTVTRGPTKPVCRKGTPCSEPANGSLLVFTRDGHVAARVVVANGRYTVSLAPGLYTLSAETQTMVGRGITPATVHVAGGQLAHVDFQIDTGIR